MGYKALITLDLPNASSEQREEFYKVLTIEKWTKMNTLTTAWKATFNDDIKRDGAIRILKSDMQKAKETSKIKSVEYAIQLDTEQIVAGII